MVGEVTDPAGGTLFSATYTGDPREIPYASITAPGIVRCTVTLNGTSVDVVYVGAGGSHSWWGQSGGGILPRPLRDGDRLEVTVSGPAAFRIDW